MHKPLRPSMPRGQAGSVTPPVTDEDTEPPGRVRQLSKDAGLIQQQSWDATTDSLAPEPALPAPLRSLSLTLPRSTALPSPHPEAGKGHAVVLSSTYRVPGTLLSTGHTVSTSQLPWTRVQLILFAGTQTTNQVQMRGQGGGVPPLLPQRSQKIKPGLSPFWTPAWQPLSPDPHPAGAALLTLLRDPRCRLADKHFS